MTRATTAAAVKVPVAVHAATARWVLMAATVGGRAMQWRALVPALLSLG